MAEPAPPRNVLFETRDHDRASDYLTGIYGGNIRLDGRKKGTFRLARLGTETFTISTATQLPALPDPATRRPLTRDTRPWARTAGAGYAAVTAVVLPGGWCG
ncbi:hypothetical protein [Amycolatopsis orientalis]|uniref:hypothetical protein n=1 Tax=Amycolatopsis orientalis TaxID=31958 RepID=UPI000B155A7E|nr:hypothetical protein [Amycolatopsis orientalis]